MIQCDLNRVRERDMDLLFMQAFMTDPGFVELVLREAGLDKGTPSIVKAELSQSIGDLGETDIYFIVEIEGLRYGILIEDKVDAQAMPDQYKRYIKRGEWGVKHGRFSDFVVFLFSPEKYHELNEEAQKYDHFISYETFLQYFNKKDDPISILRCQQLAQAIRKAKRPAATELDQNMNSFFVQYKEYQKRYYPTLNCTTKDTSNGWWPHYPTRLGTVYLFHKMQEGYVDLTFSNAAGELATLEGIAGWLREHGVPGALAVKTSMAGSIRIVVPKLRVKEAFVGTSEEDLNACFDAIQALIDFANIAELAGSISKLQKK